MNKDLIIDANSLGVEIALLEDKRLVELHQEKTESSHLVGDVYLGVVKKIMPGLNAAFVDVGHSKDAFLHYLDLGLQFNTLSKFTSNLISGDPQKAVIPKMKLEASLEKSGKISTVLKQGQAVLVQVAKEAISTKGPRLTSEISFAGRFLVIMPFSNKISVSSKIKSIEERNRLRRLVNSIRPNNFGVIIRTSAEGKNVAELDLDLKDLLAKWEVIYRKLPKTTPIAKLVSEIDKSSAILRDMLSSDFTNIFVNNVELYEELKKDIKNIYPDKDDLLKLYKLKTPIFDQFGVTNQIRNSFGKVVTIRSGIYLVIEQTEAMCVIDVNSGHRTKSANDQEENALIVNMEAAEEVARQMRLRDIGGLIVIDFIDLHLQSNRKILYDKVCQLMKQDKARHTVLPLSKFCLMQITRQRVRPIISFDVSEICPVCGGSGKIKSSVIVIDEIENDLKFLVRGQNEKKLTLIIHPFVYAYLVKGLLKSIKRKWEKKYKTKLKLQEDSNFSLLEYQFLNSNNEIIKLQ
ncbi:MAG: Rne/Rng family ribonuclease [Bacteroidales bacterium]|jgi:ribonuclease G|nr:Rne/Rng family ribonuclease [Bacteroidales bacterium]